MIYEGWKFANALMQLIAGQQVEKGDDFVTRDFTKANVGELDPRRDGYLTADWFGGDGYEQKFLTAWGVK